jgi:hypothetical protein
VLTVSFTFLANDFLGHPDRHEMETQFGCAGFTSYVAEQSALDEVAGLIDLTIR